MTDFGIRGAARGSDLGGGGGRAFGISGPDRHVEAGLDEPLRERGAERACSPDDGDSHTATAPSAASASPFAPLDPTSASA